MRCSLSKCSSCASRVFCKLDSGLLTGCGVVSLLYEGEVLEEMAECLRRRMWSRDCACIAGISGGSSTMSVTSCARRKLLLSSPARAGCMATCRSCRGGKQFEEDNVVSRVRFLGRKEWCFECCERDFLRPVAASSSLACSGELYKCFSST